MCKHRLSRRTRKAKLAFLEPAFLESAGYFSEWVLLEIFLEWAFLEWAFLMLGLLRGVRARGRSAKYLCWAIHAHKQLPNER